MEHFRHPRRMPGLFQSIPRSSQLLPPKVRVTIILFLPGQVIFTCSRTFCKCSHRVYILMCLDSFTQQNILGGLSLLQHASVIHFFLLLCILCHCVSRPPFVYLFSCWQTFGLFLVLGVVTGIMCGWVYKLMV